MKPAAYWAITATYADGSGAPDVLLVTDSEQIAHSFLAMVHRAEPMKALALTTPASVILSNTTTQPQEGNPQ